MTEDSLIRLRKMHNYLNVLSSELCLMVEATKIVVQLIHSAANYFLQGFAFSHRKCVLFVQTELAQV